MQLQTLISNSNEFYYIDRFDDILKLALMLKAQYYYADACLNKIFGFYEDHHSLIEIDCPFKITNSVFFNGYSVPKESVSRNKTYFYVKEYPFFLFPENRRADFMNGYIAFKYPSTDDRDGIPDYGFIDKITGAFIEDAILLYGVDDWFKYSSYINTISACYQRMKFSTESIVFDDMQNDEVISSVMSSKIANGRKLLVLNSRNKNYAMYVFKALLGPITKADRLTITINPDIFERNKFMATFTVTKKKTKKVDIAELGDIVISTRAFMLNLI